MDVRLLRLTLYAFLRLKITSKWSGAWMGEKTMSITDSLKASLAKLRVEYLDLYLSV